MSYLETSSFYELGHNIHNLVTRAKLQKQSTKKEQSLLEAQAILNSMQVKFDALLKELQNEGSQATAQ